MNARAPSSRWSAAAWQPSLFGTLADVVRLAKPRVTVLVIVTGLGGMWLARELTGAVIGWQTAIAALVGLSLIVGAANALNMYLERDVDGLMARTADRPLPSGRMAPATALWVGGAMALVSLPLLAWTVNMLTAALSLVAFVMYVGLYTPLKRVTPIALLVGAIPGAAPPLLGWTAATGEIGAAGLALFAMLFFWQLPHFLAIATFRRDEYARAGIKVMPAVRSERRTRLHALLYSVLLVLSSLALVPLGVDGPVYMINAVVLGALFLWFSARRVENIPWARALFAVSLVYLPLMIAAMMVSA